MNSKLLNLAILISSCLCATNSTVDVKAWLEPAAGRTFEHHKWVSTVDLNSPLAAKLARLQVPEALRPFEDIMGRLRAVGMKNADQVMDRLRTAPEGFGSVLIMAIAALPDVAPELIPVLAADKNRDHPAIKLARDLAIHKEVLDRVRHLATVYKSTEEVALYGKNYDLANKVAAEIASDDADLPAALGLLSSFYKVMTQTASSPIVPVLDAFLAQPIQNSSMMHEFWRQLNDTERATVKRAVDKFNALCIGFLQDRYVNPDVMARSLAKLKLSFEATKNFKDDAGLMKSYIETTAKQGRFDSLYAIIRTRFSVSSEISFRSFIKQFGSLMNRLQGVVATIPSAAGPTGTTTGSTVAGAHPAGTAGGVTKPGTTGPTGTTTTTTTSNPVAGVPSGQDATKTAPTGALPVSGPVIAGGAQPGPTSDGIKIAGGVVPAPAAPGATGPVTTPASEKEARQAAKLEVLKKKQAEFARLKDQFGALKSALGNVAKMSEDFERAMSTYQV